MRTADDVNGAREGRDIIQGRGSVYKKHFIAVVTTKLLCIIIWHV